MQRLTSRTFLRMLLLGALEELSPNTRAALFSTFGLHDKSFADVADMRDASYMAHERADQRSDTEPSALMHAAGAALAHAAFKALPAYKDLLGPFAGPGGCGGTVTCVQAQFARATSRSMAQVRASTALKVCQRPVLLTHSPNIHAGHSLHCSQQPITGCDTFRARAQAPDAAGTSRRNVRGRGLPR